jgi:hypothetical protein
MTLFVMAIPLATWNATTNGTGHASPQPVTSICKHLLAVVNEPSLPSLWKAGRIAGWMEALMEHSPQTFKSLGAAEQITALQVMEKNRFVRGGNWHLLRPFL